MRQVAVLGCAVALVAAVGAEARAPEARNPFHCSIALQVSYELVKAVQGPDSALSRELHTRLVWQALAAARFPKAADAEAEADSLYELFSKDNAAVLGMAEACMKRQNAHPRFRAARLEKRERDGLAREPVSIRASLEELKGVFQRTGASPAAEQQTGN